MQRDVGGIIRAIHPLYGKPKAMKIPVTRNVHLFQVSEQRRPRIPRRMRRGIDDVIAVQRTHRYKLYILDVQARQKLLELRADFQEALFAPADEVHLIDGDDQMRNPQERGDCGVAAALLDDAGSSVHENDREVRGGRTRHHVARVLHMPRRIRDDELAARRCEVAIRHVDRNPLFPLSAESVGEIGQIDLSTAGDVSGALECLDLILHEGFRVVEQTANEGRLAVVDAPAGVEAKDVDRNGRRCSRRHEFFGKH